MNRIILTTVLIISLFVIGHANAALINVAPSGTATASSSWLADPGGPATPDKAIDEDNITAWNAGTYPIQWIDIDLGMSIQVDQIIGLTSQLPDGHTQHDIFLDGVRSFSWDGFTTDSQLLTHVFSPSVTAQTVRIQTNSSPSWVAWREIQILTAVNAAPQPETVWLFFAGLGALFISSRKRAANKAN